MATLGGSFFVYRGIDQDYCFEESIRCLADLCDELSIVCGGDDGTIEKVEEVVQSLNFEGTIHLLTIDKDTWDAYQGQTKLSHFTNEAIRKLQTDWVFNLQADEIIHENSFANIRAAITRNEEAYICERVNLWATPYNKLEVPQNRKPVSTEVIRLARQMYRAYDDAEQLEVPNVCQLLYQIRIYHMGFVRQKDKHLVKINHMQKEVFLWDVDKRIHDCKDGFNPWVWGFTPADVFPITEPLPKYIQQWAKEREVDPFTFDGAGLNIAVTWLNSMGIYPPIDMSHSPSHQDNLKSIVSEANALWWNLSKQHQIKSPE